MLYQRVLVAALIAVMGLATESVRAQSGNALDFLGDNDYVELPNESHFDFTLTMTVEAWIFVRSFDVPWQTIVHKGNPGWRLQELLGRHTIEWTCNNSTGFQQTLFGAIEVDDGLWHHLAGVYDAIAGTMTLYIDGVLDQSDVATGPIYNNSTPVWIGARPTDYDRFWNGRIDEVRIWNVARSQSEIQATMHTTLAGNEPGLVAYYRFDEGVAGGDNTDPPVDKLPDLTANGNDGTLHDFALTGDTSNWVRALVVFADSFESGNTSAWSSTVP